MKPERLQNTEIPIKKKNTFLSIILIVTLGFAVYGNALNGDFIWDDQALITHNEYIKDWSHFPKIISKDIGAGHKEGEWNSYRPFQMVTYMVDYSLWKLNPHGYHLTNNLLHIAVALCLYWLINILFKENLLSLLTAAFYVVHPVHTEAVTYIAGRADPLALLFMLLSFICYVKQSPSRYGGISLLIMLSSYVLALLSRENSLILPFLLLLYHYSFKTKVKVKAFLSIVSLVLVYILLRVTVLHDLLTRVSYTTTLMERLPGLFVAFGTYIRLLFFPFHLHMEYGDGLFQWGNMNVAWGAILLFALLFIAFKRRRTDALVFFSLSWFLMGLLPVSNIFPVNAYMYEHWLYVPSIGFFLIIANAILSLLRVRKLRLLGAIFALGLLCFYSYLTIKQNNYWKDPLSFYKRTLKYTPNGSRIYNNLGALYLSMNEKGEAIKTYKKGIEASPQDAMIHFNLGNAYESLEKHEEAITSFKRAIELKRDFVEAYNNLGVAYQAIGKNKEAIEAYTRALPFIHNDAPIYFNLGNAHAFLNQYREAIGSYQKAIAIDSHHIDAYNNLGKIYQAINKNEEAIAMYKRALELNPRYAVAYNNLAILYFDDDQFQLAIEYCDKARALGYPNPALLDSLKPYR